MTHQPESVVSQCSLIDWLNGLTNGDQCQLTGSGSALEACSRRCTIQMAAFTLLLLYFTEVSLLSAIITRMLRTMLESRWRERSWWLFSMMASSHSSSLGGGRHHRPATSLSDSLSLDLSPVRAIVRHISVTFTSDSRMKYSSDTNN